MIEEKLIRELVEERLAAFDGYIIDLSIGAGNAIKLLIDADHSISIIECMSVSRNVEHNLDREEEDFSLEVSSAGLDQPFRHIRQYKKSIGRDVEVVSLEGRKTEGKLSAVNEDSFIVLTKHKEKIEGRSKAKHWVEKENVIKFSDIKQTKVIISFK
jgi:ribosome maturation factor RimP